MIASLLLAFVLGALGASAAWFVVARRRRPLNTRTEAGDDSPPAFGHPAGGERYRDLVDGLAVIVFQTDREGRFVLLNRAWERSTGWSMAQSLHHSVLEHVLDDDRAPTELLMRQVLAGALPVGQGILRGRDAHGTLRWFDVRAMPVRDDHARIVGLSGTLIDVTKTAEAERALRRQESRYRLLASHSRDVIALVEVDGRFSFLSPSVEKVLGYSPEHVSSSDWHSIVDPLDHALVAEAARRLQDRQPVTETIRVRRSDDTLIWLEVSGDAVLDPDARVLRYRLAARDVTERREAGLALAQSEATYRMLTESIEDIVVVMDLDGTVTYCSPSIARVLGHSPVEIVGRDFFEIVHPDDRGRIAGEGHLAVLRGEAPLAEWRCQRRDGGYLWVETRTTLLREEPGEHARLVCVLRNIEQRKKTEEQLRRTEERARALFDGAAYGIYRSTPDGRFVDVNPALATMLGYDSAQDLMRLDIARDVYVDPRDRSRYIDMVESHGGPQWFDLTWKRRDGSAVNVRLWSRPVRDERGDTMFYEGIVENVTERLRREATVRRAERMASLGHTLAGVAHELNNPLAAISGFAQILLKTDVQPDDRAALETIHREARRAAKIVKDLLTFARRQESTERQRVDLPAIVRYIVDTQRYAMETHGVHCELEVSDDALYVLADPAQIEQVVLNLIVNARQALESLPMAAGAEQPTAPPTIHVTVRREGDSVLLRIADNGPGIPSHLLPRIWEPFWTTKEEGVGTGLGLSVVHGIVGAHGGSIDVDSAPGRGTAFTISFPVFGPTDTEGSPAEERAPAPPPSARAERPLDLLVVDDEDVIVGLLERYFLARGHAVVAAREGAQAIRLAEHASFDVAICDLRMPGMDGTEVIRRLQELPTCANTRFILSTGDTATPALRQRIDALPLTAVVDKPYEMEALRQIVEER